MKMYNVKVNGVLFKHKSLTQWDRVHINENPIGKVWKGNKKSAEKLKALINDIEKSPNLIEVVTVG